MHLVGFSVFKDPFKLPRLRLFSFSFLNIFSCIIFDTFAHPHTRDQTSTDTKDDEKKNVCGTHNYTSAPIKLSRATATTTKTATQKKSDISMMRAK